MPAAVGLIKGGLGLVKTIGSLINAGKTKKIARQLEASRPKLGRDALADENLAFANSELANGMSARAEKAYNDATDRELSSSLSAILKGGGNLNSVGDVYGSNQRGRENLAIMRDNLRLKQIENKVAASKAVSNRNDQMFQYNIDAPWKDKAQANAQARMGANQGIWEGLNTAGSAGMEFAQGKYEGNLFDKMLKFNNSQQPQDIGLMRSNNEYNPIPAGMTGINPAPNIVQPDYSGVDSLLPLSSSNSLFNLTNRPI
jgi:hypothetical protein